MQKKFVFVLLAVLVLAACAPASATVYNPEAPNTLSVTGTGTVSLAPDIAYISIGVHTEDADVASAVSRNAEEVDRVMASLRESGVADEDLQTTNFSVYSVDQYDFEGQRSGVLYYVDNTVYVTVRDLSRMGTLLDEAVGAGANSIWGIQFDVADRSAAEAEARELAVGEARSQAEQLAAATGVTLGDIVSVSYAPSGAPFYYLDGRGGGGADVAAEAVSTSIVPGQINISANVYIAYEMR